jgi:hypothetical protein
MPCGTGTLGQPCTAVPLTPRLLLQRTLCMERLWPFFILGSALFETQAMCRARPWGSCACYSRVCRAAYMCVCVCVARVCVRACAAQVCVRVRGVAGGAAPRARPPRAAASTRREKKRDYEQARVESSQSSAPVRRADAAGGASEALNTNNTVSVSPIAGGRAGKQAQGQQRPGNTCNDSDRHIREKSLGLQSTSHFKV